MQFRILGPLEVVADDRVVALGGGREGAVLAALLLHANQVVPREKGSGLGFEAAISYALNG
jgi:DNA-binding SARP family transcriptional activator